MKRVIYILILSALLAGCSAAETMETISDEWELPAMAQEREIAIDLPGETADVLQSEYGSLYVADKYELSIETMESGDLERTLRTVTGHSKKDLTVMTRDQDGVTRYDFVWAAAGENGDRLGRGIILDDGNYHYVLSVLRDAVDGEPSQVVWNKVLQSFTLI